MKFLITFIIFLPSIFITIYTICMVTGMVNIIAFIKDSVYTNQIYMPADRFSRIRKSYILAITSMFLYMLVYPVAVLNTTIGIVLLMVNSISIGYLLGIMDSINKKQQWSKREKGPKGPIGFVRLFVFTSLIMLIFLAYPIFVIIRRM